MRIFPGSQRKKKKQKTTTTITEKVSKQFANDDAAHEIKPKE